MSTPTSVSHHVKPSVVRKSIKKLFPLGSVFSKGSNNPITLHAADDDALARVWSLIAETMVAKSELNRNLKEKVATLVSKKNQCPVCILAHNMMVKASEHKQASSDDDSFGGTENTSAAGTEDFESIVLEYAEDVATRTLTQEENGSQDTEDEDSNDYLVLNDKTKAEIALIVMLFSHMNRVVSAIMGTEMSTAIFKVPRPVARKLETSSFMSTINRLMAPMLSGPLVAKVEAGCTDHLFVNKKASAQGQAATLEASSILPAHLKGIKVAGEARAQAVGRLVEWSERYYEDEVKAKDLLPNHVLAFLDEDPAARPPKEANLSHKVVAWISSDLSAIVRGLEIDDINQTIIIVLLYLSYAPKAIQNSAQWKELVRLMGEKSARALAIWWSVRFTLRQAKGFE